MSNDYSPTFGVCAAKLDVDDDKPWFAWPAAELATDAVKVAWGSTADEAIARWGALYYNTEGKHTFLGRTDMVEKGYA